MKWSRFLKLLSATLIFILFSVITPVSPVSAATGTISINPPSGPGGTFVTVQGNMFTVASQTYTVYFDNIYQTSIQTTTGSFNVVFQIPNKPRYSFGYPVTVTASLGDSTNPTSLNFQITPDIGLTATPSGYVGDSVLVSGKGFATGATVSIYFDSIVAGSALSDGNGSFSNASFIVPASPKGAHIIKGKDATDFSPGTNFTVNNKMTINPVLGAVGDKITIAGTGFAANSTISFYWDDFPLSSESAASAANGSFSTAIFTIPMAPRGSHTIKALDANSNESTATFAVAQRMTISPKTGVSGTIVSISGNGFLANTVISVKYNTVPVVTNPAPINTNNNGSFSGTFTTTAGVIGSITVEVSDGTYPASDTFLSTNEATISTVTSSSAPGIVGMQVTINGVGFKPSAIVTVSYTPEGNELAKTTTDASGTFSVRVTIPPMVGGDHTIKVTDGTPANDKVFPFFMEKTAPAVPELLAPITTPKVKVPKAKNLATFDWKDVTDPSGVTYTMQIALDKDFNKIGIEKKGLTKSEYALAPTEKLPSNKASTPYYWRVKATDGASNESAWSIAQAFNVGFSLELTGWVLYVILGVGGLLLFLLGFLLGSRRSLAY